MTDAPDRAYWRVGYHADPDGFVPLELCTFNHRFDDVQQRFRSIYAAELAETALREVLADLRPKAAAIRRYVERFGPDAADDVPALPVTASWRQQHVLVQVRPVLDGPLINLCDADVRYEVELEAGRQRLPRRVRRPRPPRDPRSWANICASDRRRRLRRWRCGPECVSILGATIVELDARVMDGERLDVPDGSFDAVISRVGFI